LILLNIIWYNFFIHISIKEVETMADQGSNPPAGGGGDAPKKDEKKPEECDCKKKKKPKEKKPPPILEILFGVGLFVFIIFTTSKKIDKEKAAAQQKEYMAVDDREIPKEEPAPIKSEKIDISNFSDLEQQYINDSCKDKKGNAKEKCIAKSINELLDLY
jgi:hypothetical protein